MALLRPGRCGSRRQGGCLQHRTELSGSQRDSMRAGRPRSRARPAPPCRADHSRENGRSFMKTNHQWTRINTNRPEDRWTCFNGTQRPKGIHLGARASRPHQAWHCLGHLLHLDQPGTAPWLSFGLAATVPADRVAACGIAPKLSGSQWDSMRAGRPRSRARPSPPAGWLPAALHGSSAAAKGTACGRDARAPGQGKNREHGLHLSSMHYSFPSWFFVDNSFFPFPTLGGSLSILLQPLRGYLFFV